MRILLTLLLLIFTTTSWAIDQWVPTVPASSDNPVNFPAAEVSNNNSLSRVLSNYRQGQSPVYASSTSISVSAGEVTCNSASPVVFRLNPASTTVTSANLDTGNSLSSSTTYYIYANCDASATTNTYTISLSSSAPSGVTNYKQIGSFTTDGSSAILPASVNQSASSPVMADTSGNKSIQGIFDYGTSASAYTLKTGNLKVVYGVVTISASSSAAISNMPFTSSTSYQCALTHSHATAQENANYTPTSGSAMTIYNGWPSGTLNINWICVGT